MDNFGIYIVVFGLLLASFLVFWFKQGRAKVHKFINPPSKLPKHKNFTLLTEENGTAKIWTKSVSPTQPPGDIKCVAYSLRQLMEMPPILFAARTPPVEKLFEEIAKRDDQKNNGRGAAILGAMKYLEQSKVIGKTGFFKNLLRQFGFGHAFFNFKTRAQMIEFVSTYAPFIAGMPIKEFPQISDDGFFYNQTGETIVFHAVLVYGVDERRICPDGTTGAFRVLWHCDLRGFTEGWMPFSFTDDNFQREWTYGFEI